MAKIAIRSNYCNADERPWFGNMLIGNARFMWKPNFEGRCDNFDQYNRNHDRRFTVRLEGDNIKRAMDENWILQHVDAFENEEGKKYDESYYIQVNASYKFKDKSPKIFVTKNGVVKATYDSEDDYIFNKLDRDRIRSMSMVINPSTYWSDKYQCWRTDAYLKCLYVEFEEEDYSFGGKYRFEDTPENEELPFR